MNNFELELTVTRGDIDDLNHAGNYHFIRWMQEAAIAHSSALGWSPEKYIEEGAGWVVRSHDIVYLKPAYEGDTIIVKTWVADMKAVTSLRKYEICNGDGQLLARAETNWAFINYETEKPTRIPAAITDNFVMDR